MVPSPILPLAQHAKFGQTCFDVSLGSGFVCISYSMPVDPCFFKSPRLFHQFVWLYQQSQDDELSSLRETVIVGVSMCLLPFYQCCLLLLPLTRSICLCYETEQSSLCLRV